MPGQITLAFVAANEFYEALGATLTLVKGTAATWFQIEIDNTSNTSTTVYFKGWFSATVGAVTLGTTVPDIVLPAPGGAKVQYLCPTGNAGNTGLVVACVTGNAPTSTTAPATSPIVRISYN